MPKARRRKTPITSQPIACTSSNSPQATRNTIRKFHVLLKQQAQLRKATVRNAAAIAAVEQQISELGGLELYQRMSSVGQGHDRGGGSEKVLIQWLKEMGLSVRAGSKQK